MLRAVRCESNQSKEIEQRKRKGEVAATESRVTGSTTHEDWKIAVHENGGKKLGEVRLAPPDGFH